jgi:16S rRNA (guanine966-N2)-methyltransferase
MLPGLLADDGIMYVEAETPQEACGRWRTARSGKAGQVFYHLMQSDKHDEHDSGQ